MIWHKIQGAGGTDGGITSFLGPRGVFAGGATDYKASFLTNAIDYVTIATTGNATSFGTMTSASFHRAGASNGSRGVMAAGSTASTTFISSIDYVTIATTGNASNFGNATAARNTRGISNVTRGVFASGYGGSDVNVIDYVTIATTGNASDFGDAYTYRSYTGTLASETRGVMAGGSASGGQLSNVIQYLTIDTTGNTVDFGDLTASTSDASGVSDLSRGVVFHTTKIDYITIATTGNASSFGNIYSGGSTASFGHGVSDGTRGVVCGGYTSDGLDMSNIIQYITIATLGNSTYFGDSTSKRYSATAFSGI